MSAAARASYPYQPPAPSKADVSGADDEEDMGGITILANIGLFAIRAGKDIADNTKENAKALASAGASSTRGIASTAKSGAAAAAGASVGAAAAVSTTAAGAMKSTAETAKDTGAKAVNGVSAATTGAVSAAGTAVKGAADKAKDAAQNAAESTKNAAQNAAASAATKTKEAPGAVWDGTKKAPGAVLDATKKGGVVSARAAVGAGSYVVGAADNMVRGSQVTYLLDAVEQRDKAIAGMRKELADYEALMLLNQAEIAALEKVHKRNKESLRQMRDTSMDTSKPEEVLRILKQNGSDAKLTVEEVIQEKEAQKHGQHLEGGALAYELRKVELNMSADVRRVQGELEDKLDEVVKTKGQLLLLQHKVEELHAAAEEAGREEAPRSWWDFLTPVTEVEENTLRQEDMERTAEQSGLARMLEMELLEKAVQIQELEAALEDEHRALVHEQARRENRQKYWKCVRSGVDPPKEFHKQLVEMRQGDVLLQRVKTTFAAKKFEVLFQLVEDDETLFLLDPETKKPRHAPVPMHKCESIRFGEAVTEEFAELTFSFSYKGEVFQFIAYNTTQLTTWYCGLLRMSGMPPSTWTRRGEVLWMVVRLKADMLAKKQKTTRSKIIAECFMMETTREGPKACPAEAPAVEAPASAE